MKTRVLLVNPPYDIKRYMGGLGKIGWVFPPIGLMYIASYVRKNLPESQVKIYDFQVEDTDFHAFLEEFRPDIVGITCQTALVYSTIELAKEIRELYPHVSIIVGGVHPSIRPQDLLSSPDIDIAVRGEGEETFAELAKALADDFPIDDIAGISYKDNEGRIIKNEDRPITPDIDIYPMPALNLLPMAKYKISPDMKTGDKLGLILTSRGCPYNCMFCANKLLTKRTYRMRSIKNVLDEIDLYIEKFGITQLMIIDDNFTVNKKRTLELCDKFIKRGYPKKLNWWAEGRVDCIDEEMVMKMKEAGCSILSLGLESGSQRLLDLIDKGITIEETRRAVNIIKRSGIKIRASIILGLPTETKEESEETIRFAYSLPIDQVRFSIATPFPGTALWDIAAKEGKVDPENIDWTRLSLMGGYADHEPPYYPEGRTAKEIKALQRRANFMFYMRPKIIFGFLRRIRSFKDIANLLKGLYHFVKSTIGK